MKILIERLFKNKTNYNTNEEYTINWVDANYNNIKFENKNVDLLYFIMLLSLIVLMIALYSSYIFAWLQNLKYFTLLLFWSVYRIQIFRSILN